MKSPLSGKRVLVVEDEYLIAMMIEDTLVNFGCQVVGPLSTLEEALVSAKTEVMDIALLDINLRGKAVFPVAEVLSHRSIPFLFLSGYGQDAVPADRPGWHACSKPFSPEDLAAALAQCLASA